MYDINDIIFVIPKKSVTILPARIEEVIVRKTTAGIQQSYIVTFDNEKFISLDTISGKFFNTAKDAEDFILFNVKRSIDKSIKEAYKIAKEKFNVKFDNQTKVESSHSDHVLTNSSVTVKLPTDEEIQAKLEEARKLAIEKGIME